MKRRLHRLYEKKTHHSYIERFPFLDRDGTFCDGVIQGIYTDGKDLSQIFFLVYCNIWRAGCRWYEQM